VPKLEPLLQLSRKLRSPRRERLRAQGLFTVLGAFDHAGLVGEQVSDGLRVRFAARSLRIILPSGEELGAPRRLVRVVSSVYLACRCGESRSVFVPRVTRCTLGRRRERRT
jgi:hypothetical protein